MEKIVFMLLIVITWYVGGMYHVPAFLLLAAAEILVFILMFLTALYLKAKVGVQFPKSLEEIRKNEQKGSSLCLVNKGSIPASRVWVQMRYSYDRERRKKKLQYKGYVGKKEKQEFSYFIEAPHCGIIKTEIRKVEIADYFGLFRKKKKENLSQEIAVFPPERYMKICFAEQTWDDGERSAQGAAVPFSHSQNDHYQIREYVQGDQKRRIHWNLSARTETLLVKEYPPESGKWEELFVDLEKPQSDSEQKKDAFYELLYACLLGLFRAADGVCVKWYEETGKVCRVQIMGEADVREVLLQLFRTEGEWIKGTQTEADKESGGFCLNRDLGLYHKGKLAVQFTEEQFERELEQEIWIA